MLNGGLNHVSFLFCCRLGVVLSEASSLSYVMFLLTLLRFMQDISVCRSSLLKLLARCVGMKIHVDIRHGMQFKLNFYNSRYY